jgi:TonB family protein
MSTAELGMTRRDPTILIALLVALGAHLAVLGFGVRTARRELGWWLQAPQAQAQTTPRPAPIAQNDPMQRLGEHDASGASINSAPGDQPMESAVADASQEQAAVQRDPAGFGGKGSNRQLEQTLRGDNGDAKPRGPNSAAQTAASVFGSHEAALADLTPKMPKAVPVGMAANSSATGTDNGFDPLSSGPLPVKPIKQVKNGEPSTMGSPSSAQEENPRSASEQAAAHASGGGAGGKPGSPDPGSGNPVPTSDFESFPVSHIASRFVAGRIDARTGRKMRTRELPRLGLAAIADLQTMDNPYVGLVLKIDPSGNVTDVKIARSSGSDDVDLPCQRAAYTWWFEPVKDPKTGTIHGEIIEFTIFF